MSKTFRPYSLDQRLLLPPDMREWLPEDDLAWFLSDTVDHLDLTDFVRSYEEGDGRGQPPYHPTMMAKLLLYAYCVGVPSSRKIEHATHRDIAFRVLAGDQHPDHDSIAEFRRRHLDRLAGLFVHVLRVCQAAGLVTLGQIAVDGTKVPANASRHKAMSYARMEETERRLEGEVRRLLEEAERVDTAEDAQYGPGRRGDELPAELARRETRLAKIRAAKAVLEQQARERAEQAADAARARVAAREQRVGSAKGGVPQVPDPTTVRPEPGAQYNFTDPDSRIMVDGATKSFVQAYNAQAAVAASQVVVACALTQAAIDVQQLVPILAQVQRNAGRGPGVVLADAGYFSTANLTSPTLADIDLYIPPDRQRRDGPQPATSKPCRTGVAEAMRAKLATPEGRALYARRKELVEPVFGQIKAARGFRRFSFRGHAKVAAEWTLICLTHNLLKLFRARAAPQPA